MAAMRTALAWTLAVGLLGVASPAVARPADDPGSFVVRPGGDPVPMPHVRMRGPRPVPMPLVEPREPGPVPMPRVGSSAPDPVGLPR
jgi:hypothetical protein